MKILGISLPTKSELIIEINEDFDNINQADLPEMTIKEYRNGKCRIEMSGLPIPSLCGEYETEWKAKRAILQWLDEQKQEEVVKTTTVGKSKPDPEPPKSE